MMSLRLALAATGAALVLAPTAAALAAAPSAFTMRGEAQSFENGRATKVPNTLHYQRGKIRLEMAAPVSAQGTAPFNVVLAQEGGSSITLLNASEKQAMKLEAKSLEDITENRSLQEISRFRLSSFGQTFRTRSRKVGAETVAGQPCTIYEQNGRDGHFKLWLADRIDLPLRFTYFDKGKPAFSYAASSITLTNTLPASSFNVPAGYEVLDLAEMMRDHGGPNRPTTGRPAPAATPRR